MLGVNLAAPCWLWTGAIHRSGYGVKHWQGHQWYAHRLMWTLMRGPIPAGLTLDHLCRITGCVNPQHLEIVPIATNISRGFSVSANNARKTYCSHGHAFDDENTYVTSDGRHCRACRRRNRVAWYQRHRAAINLRRRNRARQLAA